MAQAPETDRSETAQISFELESLRLRADHRLELTGRWFGVRGRRFVRPTLTLIGANKSSRSLADLEHKPWAAEDGTTWIALFALQDPGEEVLELELAVAQDVAVSLPPPPELAALPRAPGPSSSAVVAPRTPPPLQALRAGAVVQPPKPKPTARTGAAARARQTIEQQRRKLQSLEEELERAAGSAVELRSALARRDAAVEKLEAVLEQQEAHARERAIVEEDRQGTERERLTALRERDEARRGWMQAREGWTEAVRERDQIAHQRDQALIERDRARAERDQLVSQLDRVLDERDRALHERDRAMDDRHRAMDDRDRTMTERDQGLTERMAVRVRRPVMTFPEHRHRVPESRRTRGWVVWMTRLFALLVLAAAVTAIAIIIQSA